MTDRLTDQQLTNIERALPRLSEYAEQSDDVRAVAEGVPALLAEVRRLQVELAKSAEDVDWLRCLEAAGVDNWEGIDTAIEMRDE
ncbi:hypothetical protein [Streptomyces rubrogriseus]|uniref:hypothetical protein n=1 Tax=Streptomyces rubrogriseus TaxID=194673 RepID=UPI000D596632|nr:hypothetical protein [Streptomyces rubrogriseus]